MSLLDNLLSFYKLDELAASEKVDSTGLGPNLLNASSPARVAGKIGDAVGCNTYGGSGASAHLFDGGSTYFDLQAAGDMTMTFWVYFAALGSPGILSDWANGGALIQWLMWYNGSRLAFRTRSSLSVDTEVAANTFGAISTATWYFVAITRNAATGQIRINVNDTGWDTGAGATTLLTGTNDFRLGQRNTGSGGSPLNGAVDAFGFWGRILTDAEITELYNSGDGLEYPFGISLGGNSLFVMG